MDEHAMIAAHLQQLCDARDRTVPGSPEQTAALPFRGHVERRATAASEVKETGALPRSRLASYASFSINCTSARSPFKGLVASSGIEPELSALSGRRVNQLHHDATVG